jgi:hypothetical protein
MLCFLPFNYPILHTLEGPRLWNLFFFSGALPMLAENNRNNDT